MENYFYKLNHKFDTSSFKESYKKFDSIWDIHFGVKIYTLPLLLFKDSSIYPLLTEFKANPKLIVYTPNFFYRWHTDPGRDSALNLVVQPSECSHTLFGEPLETEGHYSVTELTYKPDTFYLLNVRKVHCTMNLDKTTDRLLLSIALSQPYDKVLDYCKAHNL